MNVQFFIIIGTFSNIKTQEEGRSWHVVMLEMYDVFLDFRVREICEPTESLSIQDGTSSWTSSWTSSRASPGWHTPTHGKTCKSCSPPGHGIACQDKDLSVRCITMLLLYLYIIVYMYIYKKIKQYNWNFFVRSYLTFIEWVVEHRIKIKFPLKLLKDFNIQICCPNIVRKSVLLIRDTPPADWRYSEMDLINQGLLKAPLLGLSQPTELPTLAHGNMEHQN